MISRRGFLGALGAVPLAFTLKIEAPATAPRTARAAGKGPLRVIIRANLTTLKDGIISAQTMVEDFDLAGYLKGYKVEFGAFNRPTTIVSGEMEVIREEDGVLLAVAPIAMHRESYVLANGDSLTTTLNFEGFSDV